MGDNITEQEKIQQPKGSKSRREWRVKLEASGLGLTNHTTVKDLLDSINLAVNRAFDAGKAQGHKEGFDTGYLTGWDDGYSLRNRDETEEAEVADKREELERKVNE